MKRLDLDGYVPVVVFAKLNIRPSLCSRLTDSLIANTNAWHLKKFCKLTEEELLDIPEFSLIIVQLIKSYLKKYDLYLGMTQEELYDYIDADYIDIDYLSSSKPDYWDQLVSEVCDRSPSTPNSKDLTVEVIENSLNADDCKDKDTGDKSNMDKEEEQTCEPSREECGTIAVDEKKEKLSNALVVFDNDSVRLFYCSFLGAASAVVALLFLSFIMDIICDVIL